MWRDRKDERENWQAWLSMHMTCCKSQKNVLGNKELTRTWRHLIIGSITTLTFMFGALKYTSQNFKIIT
jgi:hypothetical protein